MAITQDVITKKLPELLKNFPGQDYLQLDLTADQKEDLKKNGEWNVLLSQAVEAKFTGQDGIFEQVLENQGIDPLKTQAIWKTIEEYTILWEIIQLAEPYLKRFYTEKPALIYQDLQKQSSPESRFLYGILSKMLKEEYKFLSPEDLFITIVEEEQYTIFMDCLGLNNTNFSVNQIREILTSLKISDFLHKINDFFPSKNKTLSTCEYKAKIYKIVNYVKCNQLSYSWKEMIFFVCFFYIRTDFFSVKPELLNKLWEYYKLILWDIIPLVLRGLKKRDSKTWKKLRSYRWNNGHKIYADHQVKTLPLTLTAYHELEKENQEQKSEIGYLKRVIQDKDQRIQELECLQNPYSSDGDAICNSDFEELSD
jgi:hypothetical protein